MRSVLNDSSAFAVSSGFNDSEESHRIHQQCGAFALNVKVR